MEKSEVLPHALCGAKAKRTGKFCRQPAMKNGKCRMHGGKSTGARTQKGLDAIRAANFKHGIYSKENHKARIRVKNIYSFCKNYIRSLN
ncbi:MAG: hypothetical protein K1000chlam2_00226 [Chlamydiae bacterium]|nr:hypothetical protein [Chlamydiota bacterium]